MVYLNGEYSGSGESIWGMVRHKGCVCWGEGGVEKEGEKEGRRWIDGQTDTRYPCGGSWRIFVSKEMNMSRP